MNKHVVRKEGSHRMPVYKEGTESTCRRERERESGTREVETLGNWTKKKQTMWMMMMGLWTQLASLHFLT